MILSPKQIEFFDGVMAWMKTELKRYVGAGYAGTGKTTVSKEIGDAVGSVYFVSYTGKAANVLREKGCRPCSTIHSAIYKLISEPHEEPVYILDVEDSPLRHVDLVIVDEYSMLPVEIREDLERVAKKVLYLGDPFQLPPVQGECDLKPDYFLTEIHRQALESNILRYATDVREGRALNFCTHDDFIYQPRSKFTPEDYDSAEQIIVGLNRTRQAWNDRFRFKLGFKGFHLPQQGDKIICTRNNRVKGLFNGMIGEAMADARKVSFNEISLDFRCDDKKYPELKVWDGNFRGKDPKDCVGRDRKLDRFDFAYAITCHKAQGSEYDNVLIYNEPFGDSIERRRWQYTAITRGKNRVLLIQP